VRSLNGPKHQQCVESLWRSATILRWVAPSLFLWLQAKRNRVVVLERLPLALRGLRRLSPPAWLCVADDAAHRPAARRAWAPAPVEPS
jgi:hypothetical protein